MSQGAGLSLSELQTNAASNPLIHGNSNGRGNNVFMSDYANTGGGAGASELQDVTAGNTRIHMGGALKDDPRLVVVDNGHGNKQFKRVDISRNGIQDEAASF